MNNDKPELLILKNVKVLFSQFVDDGMGRSITIDCTDESVQNAIKEWYAANTIGLITKGRNSNESTYKPEPKIVDYEGTKQFTFKLNKNDDPAFKSDIEGAQLKDVRYTAVINLVARAFKFDNKFGQGISEAIDAIALVKKPEGVDKSAELELI